MGAAILLERVGVLRGEKWLLEDVSWEVPQGATVAVLGPNGCGKSTLLRVLCGYLYPTKGNVQVAGYAFGRSPLHEMRRHVRLVAAPSYGGADEAIGWANGYDLPAALPLRRWVLTGLEGTLLFDRQPTADESDRAQRALSDVGLDSFADRLYGTLSTGERTRVQLARALISRPKVLLLDEPALGLDLPTRERLIDTLTALHGRTTLVIVSHHPEELPPTVESALILREGRIVARGDATAVLTNEHLSRAYGLPLRVARESGRYWVRVGAATAVPRGR